MDKKIILSDRNINTNNSLPDNVELKVVNIKNIEKYERNSNVIAISGTRAMAVRCINLEFPSLKLFQLTSAGFDNVPCEKYAEKSISVANAGNVYSIPIAETVVFGILLIAKKLHSNPNNRHIKIQRHYSNITELDKKRILIMGVGNIGTATAERLCGFGVEIDGYDPFCPEKEYINKIIRNRSDLLNEINQYDYIISTLPDNEQTKGFINTELLDKMKNTAVIINVGRLSVFSKKDLYQALKKRKIGGAVLDMFEKIPNPITNRFRRLKNVIVLPGVAAISQEVKGRLENHIIKNVLAVINGEKISNVINGVNE